MLTLENLIFDERKIEYCTKRIAYQIFESNINSKEIFLVGIANNGCVFAKKVEKTLNIIFGIRVYPPRPFAAGSNPYKVVKVRLILASFLASAS